MERRLTLERAPGTVSRRSRRPRPGRAAFQPIGISCRICERLNWGQRAVPHPTCAPSCHTR
ncbi:hypothetical protein EN852_015220 [Mesorhizobium sp. M2E.F.Ca.ET.209.01.1.1]|nr:MAG: hypothetical protein EOR60_23270 [Mesorhizobium sp.]TGS13790.1 hypothetical protein EN852_015220 [Mesorhizobium sp. M2E.F.Ca.ET.209.01.1.1]